MGKSRGGVLIKFKSGRAHDGGQQVCGGPQQVHGGFAIGRADLMHVDTYPIRAFNDGGFVGMESVKRAGLAIGSPIEAIEAQEGTQQKDAEQDKW